MPSGSGRSSLVEKRWLYLTITTVLSQLALWFVLLLSLRHVGISEQEVSALQSLAVFAFGRLLGAIPITPGGLGVIELGYIGGLVSAGGNEPSGRGGRPAVPRAHVRDPDRARRVQVRDLACEEQLAATGSRARAGSRAHAGLGRIEVAGDR